MTTSDGVLPYTIGQPKFDVVRNQLLDCNSRISNKLPPEFWQRLSRTKENCVSENNQLGAKAAWCLEIIGHIQDNFISAFIHIREKSFQEAWKLLEHCESAIRSLDQHFVENQSQFGIEHVRIHTWQLQELYHLKWGVSPAILFEEVHCSVCQSKRMLRSSCGHEVGEIYDGEMCHDVITKAKLLHISIVDSPAQRYSVIWPTGESLVQFELLKYLADELLSPWDAWTYHKEIRKRHHPTFDNVARNDLCPCGSDMKYECCCFDKDKVPDFPHFQFSFESNTRGQVPNLRIVARQHHSKPNTWTHLPSVRHRSGWRRDLLRAPGMDVIVDQPLRRARGQRPLHKSVSG